MLTSFRPIIIAVVLLCLWVLSLETVHAKISGSYNFDYNETFSDSGGSSSSTDSLRQVLNINIDKILTDALDLKVNLSWYSVENDGKGDTKFYPLITLNYHPPQAYYFSFGHSRIESIPSDGDHLTRTNTRLSFNLPMDKYPGLSLSYSQSIHETHDTPKSIDRTTDSFNLSSVYGLDTLDGSTTLNFSLGRNLTENRVTQIETETTSYSMAVSTSTALLDGKGNFSANLGYNFSENSLVSLEGASQFESKVSPAQGYWCLACGAALSAEFGFIDINTTTVVDPTSTPPGDSADLRVANQHVGLGYVVARDLHKIYLYVNTTATEKLLIPGYSFGWQLFTSPDNITWTDITASLTAAPTYSATYNRFVFEFTETSAVYFKVVNTLNAGAQAIEVTEIEGYVNLLSTPQNSYSSDQNSTFGGFSLSYNPMDSLRLGYNLQISTIVMQPSDNEHSTLSQGLSLAWTVMPRYLTLSTAYNTRTTEMTNNEDSTDNGYTLTLNANPLESIASSLSYRFSESLRGSTVISDSSTIFLSTNVRLYTGISLNATVRHTNSESYAGAGSETVSTDVVGGIYLRPWDFMKMTVTASRSETETSGASSSSKTSDMLRTNLTFPLTRNLNISAGFNIEPESVQSLSGSWRPTKKLQFYARSSFSSDARSFGVDTTWRVLQNASVSFGYTGTWIRNSTSDKVQRLFIRGSVWF
jgi:hypothetical protein